jgi:putative transposase
MSSSPVPFRRRSIRLRDYDYREEAAYFITICTFHRACIFGEIIDGTMQINASGKIAAACWEAIPAHFPRVECDAFVVMPNHIHGIVAIVENISGVGAQHAAPIPQPTQGITSNNVASGSIGAVVRSFKSAVTRQINLLDNTPGEIIWQRNYHEHIIRSESSLNTLRQYVEQNPARWNEDKLHPMKNSSW